MTVREVSIKYGYSEATIRAWAKQGKFPCSKPGRKMFIEQKDFDAFMERTRLTVAADPNLQALLRGLGRKRVA